MIRVGAVRNGALVTAALVAAVLACFLAIPAAHASSGARAHVVLTAKNAQLGKTILVSHKGLTLYSLSVERRGKFICKDQSCLSFWIPLVVSKGTTPTGVKGLTTVKRPDGRMQVTYRGGPLYTFYLDRKRGDIGGEGFKDVGVWHAATVVSAQT